jgi:hypothetical protein
MASAQLVSNVRANQLKSSIVIYYNLNCSSPCKINLDLSFNDGISWYTPSIVNLSGDFGKSIYSGEHSIIWDVLKDFDEFTPNNVKFRISAEPIFGNKYDFVNIGLVPNSYNDLNNISIQIGNQSYFLSTKLCLSGLSKTYYNCDLNSILNFNSVTDNINFNNTYKVERFSILFGKIIKLKKYDNLKPLFAIGYGSYTALWGYNVFNASSYMLNSSGFANNINLSTKGLEGQIGIKIDFNKFNFIAALNMIFSSERKYYDCNFGIGFNLIKKKL